MIMNTHFGHIVLQSNKSSLLWRRRCRCRFLFDPSVVAHSISHSKWCANFIQILSIGWDHTTPWPPSHISSRIETINLSNERDTQRVHFTLIYTQCIFGIFFLWERTTMLCRSDPNKSAFNARLFALISWDWTKFTRTRSHFAHRCSTNKLRMLFK